jgi:hypothetical protein
MLSRDYTHNLRAWEIHIKPSPLIQHSDKMYSFKKEIFQQHVKNKIQHFFVSGWKSLEILGINITFSTCNYAVLYTVDFTAIGPSNPT